jgi:hypothetical protein
VKESQGLHSVEDRIGPARGTPTFDITEVSGSWVNTEATPVAIASAVIESRQGAEYVQTLGTDTDGATDRIEAKVDRCYAASLSGCDAVALTALFEGSVGEVELHANVSKGLLIIASVSRRPGPGKSYGVFAREFFRRMPSTLRRIPDEGAKSRGRGVVSAEKPLSDRHSTATVILSPPSIFLGTWRNTQRNPSVVASVTFSLADNPLILRVVGVGGGGSIDWGKFDVELLTDGLEASEPTKITGRFQLQDRDVRLHGWVKQGVLVLALFYGFPTGDSRSSYFDREFFYRESDSTSPPE